MDTDTSSYPKPALPVSSPFQTADQIGGLMQRGQALQQGALTISKQKLDLANQSFNYMTNALNSLGPNASKEDLINVGQNMVDLGLVPQAMTDQMDTQIPDDPKQMPAFIDRLRTQTATHQEMVNYFQGQPSVFDNGQEYKVIRAPQSPNQPTTIQNTGVPVALPPSTTVPNQTPGPNYGTPTYMGNPPQPGGPGGVTTLPPVNGTQLPIAPPPATISPPQMLPANVSFNQPALNKDQSQLPALPPTAPVPGRSIQQAANQPSGPAAGMPPLFDAGKQQYVADQDLATARQTAIKPALQALPLLQGLQTGPGTDTWNKAVAGLKAFGILPTDVANDPTAIYQEVEKKLAQYVSGNPVGQRSDAAQTLAEASSPNPKQQINPALIQLTKDSIVLDRLAAARAGSFTDAQGDQRTDFQNYGSFRSQFPPSIDERAFGLDLMPPDQRQQLLDTMKKNANTFAGQKFWKSLQTVKNLNLYNVSGQ